MSDRNRYGKRQAVSSGPEANGPWQRHRVWVANLTLGQKIRYRLFQTVVVLSLVVIAVFLAVRAWIRLPEVPEPPQNPHASASQGEDMTFEGADLPDVAKSGRKTGFYTFLVVGQDVVSGSTDTMILITYDTKNKEIDAISLLRDTMINTSAASKRLNSVYSRNRGSKDLPDQQRVEQGMNALRQEVRKLTGVYPDFYVLVQWEAIGELVDAIGGVYFEVPFDMHYDDPTPGQDLHIHQEAGYRLLNGDDAMQVIRFRKNNTGSVSLGDSGRTEIQRDFLVAVLEECLQADVLLKLPTLAQIFTENVKTNLSVGNILAFAELAIGMDPETDVTVQSMPWTGVYYGGAALVLPIQDELLAMLNDGINPYIAEIKASDLQLMYQKSNGSFGVTSGALADPNMGRAPAPPPKPKPPQPEEPKPVEPENPSQTDPEKPDLPTDPNHSGGQDGSSSSASGSAGSGTDGSASGSGNSSSGTDGSASGSGNSSSSGSSSSSSSSSGSGGDAPQGEGGLDLGTGDPNLVFPDQSGDTTQDVPPE